MIGPIYNTGAVSSTGIISSATTLLASHTGRAGFFVQNLSANPLYVKFGVSASTTNFDVILKASTSQDDGSGGTVSMENGVVYNGIVTVTGTSVRCCATEFYLFT